MSTARQAADKSASRRRVPWRLLRCLVALVLLVTFGWLLYYRASYHTFNLWAAPPRISYCGRDYDRYSTDPTPGSQSELKLIDTIEPQGWKLYSVNQITSHPGAGEPCTMGLLLAKADHQWVDYTLSGGP